MEGPGQLLTLQGQLVAQPHHHCGALRHPHLDGPCLWDPGVGEDGPCRAGRASADVDVPPGTPSGVPPSLTGHLSGDQVAAADGQTSVRDGAEGDKDLPPALRWEAVKLHLPL